MDAAPIVNPWDWIYATREMPSLGWFEPDLDRRRAVAATAGPAIWALLVMAAIVLPVVLAP